jgi:hypothetical protein
MHWNGANSQLEPEFDAPGRNANDRLWHYDSHMAMTLRKAKHGNVE